MATPPSAYETASPDASLPPAYEKTASPNASSLDAAICRLAEEVQTAEEVLQTALDIHDINFSCFSKDLCRDGAVEEPYKLPPRPIPKVSWREGCMRITQTIEKVRGSLGFLKS
jgi:hypothetical protein